jgi:3-hydroxybutyryl-CoA dehydrogenase
VGAGLSRPGLLVGLHFFNPAPRMSLVEVVRGDATDPKVVETATELVRDWGKTPVQCSSTPGFVVNRVARPFYGEAQRLAERGAASPATIDAVLREAGGFPMGPFQLTDLVGQDVNLAVSTSVWEQTYNDPRYAPTQFQRRLVDAGRLGRKSGRGVYTYTADGTALDAEPETAPRRPAPSVVELVEYDFGPMTPFLDRVAAGGVEIRQVGLDDSEVMEELPGLRLPGGGLLRVTDGSTARSWGLEAPEGVVLLDWAHDPATCSRVALLAPRDLDPEVLDAAVGFCQAAGVEVSVLGDVAGGVVARTVAMLVDEAVDLVARGEATATDVDVAMLLGAGYPSGPLEWGDRVGALRIASVLGELHDEVPTGRYRMSPRLDEAIAAEENLRDL